MSSIARRVILAPLGYERTRLLLSLVGTALLLVVAAIMAARGVDRVEVIAALLYIPIFLVLMIGGVKGGLLAGLGAAAMYLGMRWSAIEIVGGGQFVGLIVSRSAAYLAFGGLGGWAATQLESPLRKLEDHDLVDDATGLFNARFLVRQTKLESSRADRYGTPFSIVVLSVPYDRLKVNGRRASSKDLRPITELLRTRIRTVDRAVHADTGDRHLFAIILAETPAEGAAIVVRNLTSAVQELPGVQGKVEASAAAYPGGGEALEEIVRQFEQVDRMEHPDDQPAAG